ncbi:MAG: DUF305 domain-containing protein [Nocardioidaceae bacterium]
MPSFTKLATRRPPALTATPQPHDARAVRSVPVAGLLPSARLLLAAVALTGALTACSGNDDASSGVSAGHNAADVTFATNMIPHHAQAIEMSDMALSQSQSPEVVDLARAIKKAQQPEIDTMTGWLKGWGEPVPDPESVYGMDHGMSDDGMSGMEGLAGMMSAADMERLGSRTGRAFDTMWLTMMIEHHDGAIEMAKNEIADGASGAAMSLAHEIEAAQRTEIEKMHKLLDVLAD